MRFIQHQQRVLPEQARIVGPASVRVLFALHGSGESACPPELLLRYDVTFGREFNRALTRLLELKSRPALSQTAPYFPSTAGGHTWKENDIAKRTQAAIEDNEPHS